MNLQNHAFSELSYCRDLSLRDNLIKYEKINVKIVNFGLVILCRMSSKDLEIAFLKCLVGEK